MQNLNNGQLDTRHDIFKKKERLQDSFSGGKAKALFERVISYTNHFAIALHKDLKQRYRQGFSSSNFRGVSFN